MTALTFLACVDENVNEHVMDFFRCCQFYLQQMIGFMDNIETGVVPATSSKNEDKYFRSTKLVIFANFSMLSQSSLDHQVILSHNYCHRILTLAAFKERENIYND